MTRRFLWDLTYKELSKGVKAFIDATGLHSGSILGSYDLYKTIEQEWTRARAGVNKNSKGKFLPLLCEHAVLDQRNNVVCIRNLEFPTYCSPKTCPYLTGGFE